ITNTSGCSAVARATASSALPASPTTVMSGSSSRMRRRPLRTTAWSSHSATRIASGNGHLQVHGGPVAGLAGDLDPSVDQPGALGHAGQSQGRAHELWGGVEAGAVIGHVG